MRIPKEFTHKGKLWKVTYEKDLKHEDGTECDGLCDLDERSIILNSKLSKDQMQITFFHELFHVVVFEAHVINGCEFTEDIEDILANAFGDLMSSSFSKLQWKKS